MGAIYKECVGCNLRYASIDEDLCEECYSDYQIYTEYEAMTAKEAKSGKGRVPMPPPSKVMDDSRTKRNRTRGDSERSEVFADLCYSCRGTGRSGSEACPDCDGLGFNED